MHDLTARTLKAMRFAADLQDNEDNMDEETAMCVTCDQYSIDLETGDDLIDILPDNWEAKLQEHLCGEAV